MDKPKESKRPSTFVIVLLTFIITTALVVLLLVVIDPTLWLKLRLGYWEWSNGMELSGLAESFARLLIER